MSWPTNEEWQSKYERKARNPAIWRDHALALREVAGLLWNHIEHAPAGEEKARRIFAIGHTAMMLEGLAVENLAKAVLVKKEPGVVAKGKWAGGRGHDLPKLFERIGLQFELNDEKDLAVRLTAYVKWAGRYPVSLDFEEEIPTITEHAYGIPPGHYYSTGDREKVDALWKRLEVALKGDSK